MKKKIFPLIAVVALLLFLTLALTINLTAANAPREPARIQKTIVLNFDDGPRPKMLEELLPLLKKHKVPAAFFVIGATTKQNQEWLKKIHKAGYKIENHSWGHENFKKLFREKGAAAVASSIRKCSDAIFRITGRNPRFFRPPFWEINEEIEKIVAAEGYKAMKLNNPDINTLDYDDFAKGQPPGILTERIKKIIREREKNGDFSHVLVFHELPLTVMALEILIPYFQTRNYEFISLETLYGEKK